MMICVIPSLSNNLGETTLENVRARRRSRTVW